MKNWVDHEYPAIEKLAKAEHAEIQWGDEMGVRSDAAIARCFSPRGQTPIVLGPGKRFGCSMISSISNRGTLRFMVFTERFNTGVMLRFLKRLLKQMKKKIFLIVDGHPVHRSSAVKKFVAEKKDQIRLFHLPAYSPELNPDEMLNQDVKTNAVRRKPTNSQEEWSQIFVPIYIAGNANQIWLNVISLHLQSAILWLNEKYLLLDVLRQK